MVKVIYVTPNYEEDIAWFEKLTNEEKLHVAKNENEMEIYSLEGFEAAFNEERISDLGFIYIINC